MRMFSVIAKFFEFFFSDFGNNDSFPQCCNSLKTTHQINYMYKEVSRWIPRNFKFTSLYTRPKSTFLPVWLELYA
jgi:hypothetical protein